LERPRPKGAALLLSVRCGRWEWRFHPGFRVDRLGPVRLRAGPLLDFTGRRKYNLASMRLAVGATRMQLLRLKKRLAIARRGHKLLKDKQEELMRLILALVDEIRTHRQRVERETAAILGRFAIARAAYGAEALDEAVMLPSKKVSVKVTTRNIMNVKVPVFHKEISGKTRCYGFATTSGELDFALAALDDLLDPLLILAEKEKSLELLAAEIERTRRRVNALEYVLIPNITETVKFINLKLAEAERGDLTRLMRVKEIIRGEAR
jgi:V/A-type H+-transporting ATPase subunit D